MKNSILICIFILIRDCNCSQDINDHGSPQVFSKTVEHSRPNLIYVLPNHAKLKQHLRNVFFLVFILVFFKVFFKVFSRFLFCVPARNSRALTWENPESCIYRKCLFIACKNIAGVRWLCYASILLYPSPPEPH